MLAPTRLKSVLDEALGVIATGRLILCDAQFFQFSGDVLAVRIRFHFLVDEQDFAVRADVNRPAKRNLTFRGHDAIGFGNFLGRVAEDGVIEFERLSKLGVDVFCVTTSCKISDLELLDGVATLTE